MILPGALYDEMLDLLLDKKLSVVKLLGRVTDTTEDREHIVLSLIKIFEEKNMAVYLLNHLAEEEIQKTSKLEKILRKFFKIFKKSEKN